MIQINGIPMSCEGCTLAEYLAESDYDIQRIAVERNDEIVPKMQYAETMLTDGDRIEIVSFVGGG